jgi:glycosyltransferase involved in cell wall biosynthesis
MTGPRPLLLNAKDTGGAANATRRIHEGLREIGVDSRMLVDRKSTRDPTIHGRRSRPGKAIARLRPIVDSLPLKLYDDDPSFSPSLPPERLSERISRLEPDVLHLNWMTGGFMDVSTLAEFDQPIVWRFPDMWPMTGGCHYTDGCTGYHDSCGECPKLESDQEHDLSRLTMWRKKRALAKAVVTVVATTPWLADCAGSSALFGDSRIEVIPNGLDTNIFHPAKECVGRDLFNLPAEAPLVLFGSVGPLSDPRKGYDLLHDALAELETNRSPELVIFGTPGPADPPDFGYPTHYAGYLNDEQSLALLYSAADVMVVPSRYEAFGQTVTEAMACGTPVVAFDGSGPADTIDHEETGYLAEAHDPADLAAGIDWIIATDGRLDRLGEAARDRAVTTYHYTDVAERYRLLYEEIA